MASVFIKVPVSDRLPKQSGGIIGYCDTADILQQFYFDSKKGIFHDPLDDEETPMRVTIWLEEIELPTDDQILEATLIKQEKDQTQFMRGIDFLMNWIKKGGQS